MEAIPFHKRAIEIDPDFAHAYSQLAIMYWVTNRPGLAAEYAKKSCMSCGNDKEPGA